MKISLDIHPIQYEILKVLLFCQQAKFSELNVKNISSDHFNFHLKRLISLDCVEKTSSGQYILTPSGKEFANSLDTENNTVEKQAKVSVRAVCIKYEDGQKKYLLEQRLKQPYYGYFGFSGGKIKWGETTLEATARELEEETGLRGDIKLVGVKHKMDYDQKNNLLEDKFFFIHKVENIKGKFKEISEGGKYIWMTRAEVEAIENKFDAVMQTLDMVDSHDIAGYVIYYEDKYNVIDY